MGAARLLAKGWVLFCVYGGGLALVRALAAGAPAAETAWTISVCVVLFGAMGLLFISGYGLSAGHVRLFGATGLTRSDIGFWCSGSSDYLAGRAFSFVSAVDAIGAVPPTMESHVEMDAAWALYEA